MTASDAELDDQDFDGTTGDADPSDIEYMFAQTAAGLDVDPAGVRITLNGVSATTLLFSDRPDRVTGHIPTADFVDEWGVGDDSFADVPPNAVLSIFDGDEVNDVVVVLSDPTLIGDDLTYAVEVTDGELVASNGPASLFIDMIGRPLTPMSVAGVRRRRRRRGRRRVRRMGRRMR